MVAALGPSEGLRSHLCEQGRRQLHGVARGLRGESRLTRFCEPHVPPFPFPARLRGKAGLSPVPVVPLSCLLGPFFLLGLRVGGLGSPLGASGPSFLAGLGLSAVSVTGETERSF